jgi:competence protein ComEA
MRRMVQAAAVGLASALLLAPLTPIRSPLGPAVAMAAGVDLNSATQAELEAIPGIGPAKAKAIVEYRSATPFATADELQNVSGIGAKLYERIKDQVTVGATPAKR